MMVYGIALLIVGLYAFTYRSPTLQRCVRTRPPSELATDGPLISVLIPAPMGDFFGRHAGSLIGARHRNFEVVVCDDNSTDGTWEVISRYAQLDNRIRNSRAAVADGWRGKVYAMEQLWKAAKAMSFSSLMPTSIMPPQPLHGWSAMYKNVST